MLRLIYLDQVYALYASSKHVSKTENYSVLVKHYLFNFDYTESSKELINAFSKARMLAFCGHTWWRKPENQGKTTDLGRATTTLPHADTGFVIF